MIQGLTCLAHGDDTVDPALSRSVASALEKSKAEAENITLPVSKDDDAGVIAAREMAKIFHSPAFQDKIKEEEHHLSREVVKKCEATGSKQNKKYELDKSISQLRDSEKIYLFLSSSMPDETVHAYLRQIADIQDVHVSPVMRGMVNGLADRKANTQYFSRILKEDMGCRDTNQACNRFKTNILSKPVLFVQYGIAEVPALVYDNGDDIFVIKGDAGLGYLLGRINHQAQSKKLTDLIRNIEGRSF